MKLTRLITLAAILPAATHGVGMAQDPGTIHTATALQEARAQVMYDAREDGSLWAAGATWKMGFDAEGATFVPFMGSDAPHNYPMRFRIESARVGASELGWTASSEVSRDGNRVNLQRGALVESYELTSHSVEQLFTLAEFPRTGDLVLEISVETELAGMDRGEALAFVGERGEVSYSKAIAIDADGSSLALATTLAAGKIEIRVPQSFLADATAPLTIDPLIGTLVVDGSTNDDDNPDTAWDESNSRFIVVWERAFSGSDNDIYSAFVDDQGDLIPFSAAAIDATAEDWGNPSVANVNETNQFLVVAEEGANGSRSIVGRMREATGVVGFPIQISNISGEEINPSVGGDPRAFVAFGIPTRFLVVYERLLTGSNGDILGQLVSNSGVLVNDEIFITSGLGTDDEEPNVSKSNQGSQWKVVWQREQDSSNHNIRGAAVNTAGTIVDPSFIIDTAGSQQLYPTTSNVLDDTDLWLVTYQHAVGTTQTLRARLMDGTSIEDTMDVGAEDGSNPDLNHHRPDVDNDGCRFVVTYTQQISGFDSDAYVTTLGVSASGLEVDEGAVLLEDNGLIDQRVRIASARGTGGEDGRFFMTWHRDAVFGSDGQIQGAAFETATPDNDCCENAELVTGTGVFPFDTTGAVSDGGAVGGCAPGNQVPNDVWYLWQAPASDVYSVSTCGATGENTVIAIYDEPDCNVGGAIACDYNSCGNQSQVLFNAIAGTMYRIRIGTVGGEGGGTFRIQNAEPGGVSYCTSAPNSVSAGGSQISISGSTSTAANDLVLFASPLPPGVPGIFYFGALPTNQPFGNGFRCVGGQTFRLPVTFVDGAGLAARATDNNVVPMTQFNTGLTWFFQYWHRDPAGGGAAFNLSNGLELTFIP